MIADIRKEAQENAIAKVSAIVEQERLAAEQEKEEEEEEGQTLQLFL